MSDAENSFSNYGIYDVNDSLEISLPNTEIKIERIGENAFGVCLVRLDYLQHVLR